MHSDDPVRCLLPCLPGESRDPVLPWAPAFETVRKSEISVIPGLGRGPRARNPGTQTSASLGMAGVHGFRAWSCGPSRNDEEVSAPAKGIFLTASFAGATGKSKQGSGSRIVKPSTKTGGFAADLLQVQPSATIGSIHDCGY